MLFTSSIVTAASGSVGGLTASRNRFGMYLRAKTMPVNPNTPEQIAARNAFGDISTAWSEITSLERDGWETYAINTPVVGKLGAPVILTGFNMYVRCNSVRLRAELPIIDTGPGIFGVPAYTPLGVQGVVSGPGAVGLSVAFEATDDWVGEDDAAMLLFVSRPVSPTVNFFRGPFQAIAPILGDLALPPTVPHAGVSPFTGAIGQKIFMQSRLTRADGRLSSSQIIQTILTS